MSKDDVFKAPDESQVIGEVTFSKENIDDDGKFDLHAEATIVERVPLDKINFTIKVADPEKKEKDDEQEVREGDAGRSDS